MARARFSHWSTVRPTVCGFTLAMGAGCVLGPSALERSRARYNAVLQQTTNEQLLLNLIRLHYREAPLFLEVGSVSAQFNFSASGDAQATLNEGPSVTTPDVLRLGSGVSYEERPTITLSPLQGEDFVNRILSPLPLDTVAMLSRSGWSIERVLRLTVQGMNDVDNASAASGPTPTEAPDYNAFLELTRAFRRLQQRGELEVGHETIAGETLITLPKERVTLEEIVLARGQGYALVEKDGNVHVCEAKRTLVWRIPAEARGSEEVDRIRSLLKLDPSENSYPLELGIAGKGMGASLVAPTEKQISVTTRSLMGVLFYLSHAVATPTEHRHRGWITTTRNKDGTPFDWGQVLGDLVAVRSQRQRPSGAAVAVEHLGHWYYVDNASLATKSTMALLNQLFALQAGSAESVTPVLTLPVGG